jgi:hypothetical protein
VGHDVPQPSIRQPWVAGNIPIDDGVI